MRVNNRREFFMSIEFWIFLAVIAILLEALTTNSFLISLGIGAVGAVAADYFGYAA